MNWTLGFHPGSLNRTPRRRLRLPEDLHDRIGQMVLVGFRGLTPREAEPTLRQIRAGSIGGAVIYDVDAQTGGTAERQVAAAAERACGAVKDAGSISPLVAVDAEGGFFHKLKTKFGFPPTVAAADLGERNDLAFTRYNAGVVADVLVEAGIDMNRRRSSTS